MNQHEHIFRNSRVSSVLWLWQVIMSAHHSKTKRVISFIQKKKKKKSPISTALRTAIYFPLTLLMQLHKIEGREFIAGYVRIKYWVLSHQAPQTITELLRSSLLPAGQPLLSEEIRTKLAVCICVFCCFCCYSCSDLLFWPLSLITFCVAHRIICILLTSECVYIKGGFCYAVESYTIKLKLEPKGHWASL